MINTRDGYAKRRLQVYLEVRQMLQSFQQHQPDRRGFKARKKMPEMQIAQYPHFRQRRNIYQVQIS